jgi:DNA-binding response OmpR family regulator
MLKIVIFDDNAELLRSLQLCLEHYGFEVKGATSKNHFYSLLDTYNPDVLIIDVNIGGEDGRLICRTLKEDAKYEHLPVVLFSASPEKLHDYKTYGADEMLAKPFEIKNVSPCLFSAIEKRKAALQGKGADAN